MRGVLSLFLIISLLLAGSTARAAGPNGNPTNDKPAAADTNPPATSTSPAASSNSKPAPATTAAAPATETEIQQLRELLEAQQAEISALKEQLNTHGVRDVPASAASTPAGLAAGTQSATGATPSANLSAGMPQSETPNDQPAPLSIKIGTAQFTPGGFVDFEDTWRSTNVGSGIGTSFNTIPYNNTAGGQGGLTENRISAQNSRLNLKITTPAVGGDLLGYVETDFNGNSAGNLYANRNAATLRLRLFFADYTRGDWEILGGQDWTMLTPNRKGINPLPQDIFTTLLLDANDSVGLVSARQTQFRVVYHPTDRWTMGVSAENSDPWTGTSVTFPACFAGTGTGCTNSQTNQVDTGAATTSPSSWPDIIAKIARDQDVGGKNWHFEVAGLLTNDKLYTPTSVSGGPGASQSKTGGGVSANIDLQLTQKFHLIANSFWSDGGGRYLYTTGPNFVVAQNPASLNFYPSLEHAGSGLAGYEWQINHKFQWFSYYGGNYFSQNYSVDPNTQKKVGYGYPGSSNAQNREMQEISTGFAQSFWRSENYGALQFITQGSYVTRSPWVAGTGPANAHEAVLYLDLRYIIP